MSIIEVNNLKMNYKVSKKQEGLKGAIKGLFSKEYSVVNAVNDISFKVEEGEFIGLIGKNGAGKTTLLKLLSGILNPTSGTAKVMGNTPWELKTDFKKDISIIMGQRSQLWWDLPATETFAINKEIYEIPDKEYKRRLNTLVDLLDVKEKLNVQVRKLSLGQRMKMEFIAALLHGPKVIFLDEPTIGLDLIAQKSIRKFLKEVNQIEKSTIILTSHYMTDIVELCEKTIIVNEGKLVYDGAIKDITKDFNNYENITFNFENEIIKEEIEKIGTVVRLSEQEVTFNINRNDISNIVQLMLNSFDINDINIEELPIEDTIYKLLK